MPTKYEVLELWEELSVELKELKKKEKEYRDKVLALFFDYTCDDRTGTENRDLGPEHKLKSVFKLSYKVENKTNEAVEMLNKLAAIEPGGEEAADNILKWEPKLVMKEYNNLSPEMKKIVDTVVTTKPGTPAVSIVGPKE